MRKEKERKNKRNMKMGEKDRRVFTKPVDSHFKVSPSLVNKKVPAQSEKLKQLGTVYWGLFLE